LNSAFAADPAEALKSRIADSKTGVIYLGNSDNGVSLEVWYDKPAGVLGAEFHGVRQLRYFWDGAQAWMSEPNGTPVRLNSVEPALASLWSDLSAGLETTHGTISPDGMVVDLAGPIDDGYTLSMGPNPIAPFRVRVQDNATKEWVVLGRDRRRSWISMEPYYDIPLHPHRYTPAYAGRLMAKPRGMQSNRVFRPRRGWSYPHQATMVDLDLVSGEERAHVRIPTCEKGLTEKASFTATFQLGADEMARVVEAQGMCPITLSSAGTASYTAPAGSRACVTGALRLLGPGGAVLFEGPQVKSCSEGKDAFAEFSQHTPLVYQVPPTTWPGDLLVELEGEVSVECLSDSAQRVRSSSGTQNYDRPKLTWFGCYPKISAAD
jgi:hypothetical protein